jgi:nickel-dependent lactate racemase
MTLLRYGAGETIRLDVAEDVLLGEFERPRGEPIRDVYQAAAHALQAPFDFPPLSQAVVSGDRVVVAVGAEVQQALAIVSAVVDELTGAGIPPGDITVLTANPLPDSDQSEAPLAEGVHFLVHDPADKEKLSYLAASDEAKPIYLNRLICDADLVLTIGCERLGESLGYHGINSSLFPTFSDAKTVQRYRSPAIVESPVQNNRLSRQADQARWLLGSQFAIQVVPGPGDSVLHVIAGQVESVGRRAAQLCSQAWTVEAPQRADLVVTSLTGQPNEQTWDNFARALSAAMRVVNADGAIVVCTDLELPPGPAMQYLASSDDREHAVRDIIKEQPPDALPAMQLMHALEKGPVYLLSRLDESQVEDLGMAAISDPQQVARLIRRAKSCIVLADAQFCVPTARESRHSKAQRA